MRIIFIRHGRTQSNVNRRLDTAYPGAPLDETGEAQAATLPQRLEAEPIEVVMTSDIVRARQTGEPLAKAKGVPLITHPGVREIYAGDWEMSGEQADWEGYIKTIESWASDPTLAMPNGEAGTTFFQRFDQAIAELQDYECAAVVSHGGALWTWLAARGDLRITNHLDMSLENTDTVVVEGVPGAWRILSWADQEIPR